MNILGKLLPIVALLFAVQKMKGEDSPTLTKAGWKTSRAAATALAADVPLKLMVFYAPLFETENEPYPQVPNRLENCLPGKLYDIGPTIGIALRKGELMVFNPESKMLVVYSTADNLDMAGQVADASRSSPYVTVEGAVSIGADADGKNPACDLAKWQVEGLFGKLVECSSADDHGVSYHFRGYSVMSPDMESLDADFLCKIEYAGRVYGSANMPEVAPKVDPKAFVDTSAKLEGSFTIFPGKRVTLKLGVTPEGKGVYLHVGVRVKTDNSVSPFTAPGKKKKLLKDIEKHLAEQLVAMEPGKSK